MAIRDDTQYGVTPNGFVRMRLPEIRKNLFDRLDAKLGVSVSRKPNSVIGVLVGLIAEESDRQWELAEYDYYARSPVSADEGSIDNTIIYSGVMRKQAESTYLYLICYGNNNMVLPSNCQVKGTDDERYNILSASTISLNNAVNVSLRIENVKAGELYSFLLNSSVRASYVAQRGDAATTIYARLITQIADSDWNGSVDNNGNLVLSQKDRRYGGRVVPTENMEVVEVGSPVIFVAENTGPLDPEIGSITEINTIYDGWTRCSNETAAYVGRDNETVTELRQRYAAAVYAKSVSMKESIKAGLMGLQGVDNVTIYENRSDVTVDGLKPHSFLAIVHGGDDMEIAQAILNKAPIGIDTNGDIELEVKDSEGTAEKVRFSRPVEVPIWVKVIIHEYKEETLPGDLVNTVKKIVVDTGKKLNMGVDVISQRFVGPIYSEVNGISYLDISISKDGSNYVDKSIPIDRGEVATFSTERVTVAMEI